MAWAENSEKGPQWLLHRDLGVVSQGPPPQGRGECVCFRPEALRQDGLVTPPPPHPHPPGTVGNDKTLFLVTPGE